MSGIDRTSGHVGMSQATRMSSALKTAGGTAFEIAANFGTAAAGAMGGPAAGAAASSAMSALRGGIAGAGGGGGGGTGGTGAVAGQIDGQTDQIKNETGAQAAKTFATQMELFNLQQSVNSQSQAFNTLTNVQKSKHDAAMAAIQNTR